MPLANEFKLVVAATDADGVSRFFDHGPPADAATRTRPGVSEATWLWEIVGGASLPDNIGGPAEDMLFPRPAGCKFGIFRFAANSAGNFNADGMPGGRDVGNVDADIHASQTVDIEIILSGKVDIALPSGELRVLTPGSVLVMAGAPHAWRNHYDEDCTFAGVVLGADVAS